MSFINKAIIIIAFIIILFITYTLLFVNPMIIRSARMLAEENIVYSTNEAVIKTAGGFNYDDFVNITFDDQGKVRLLKYYSFGINKIASEISNLTKRRLDELSMSYSIPVGALTGIWFISNFGNKIKVHVDTISSVNVSFHSQFSMNGVNQTLHRIIMSIETTSRLIMPLIESEEIFVSVNVVICENIIVGEIPNTYLVTLDEGNMLDLLN